MRRGGRGVRHGADHWREGTFEGAVRAGIRSGRLRELPLGWLEAIEPPEAKAS